MCSIPGLNSSHGMHLSMPEGQWTDSSRLKKAEEAEMTAPQQRHLGCEVYDLYSGAMFSEAEQSKAGL